MDKFIMSLDLGTSSARCVIFDKRGKVRGIARRGLNIFYPGEGEVEQLPEEFLLALKESASEALLEAKTAANHIEAIGITNQRETVVLWDRVTGKALTNAYSWQCNRGESFIRNLTKEQKEKILNKTGLIASPYFSASKIAWALENISGLRQRAEAGEVAFGTPDSWIIYNLTGGRSHYTDYTNASRTMLFDINTLKWDKELLDIFGIPKPMLPEACPSVNVFGEAHESFFGSRIPVAGVAGDQQSALFGHRCFNVGDVKNTYGTGCFMLMNMGEKSIKSKRGLITTLTAASLENKPSYALEGSIFMCGALLDWLRDGLGIIENSQETDELAMELDDNDGVYMVPALTGLGAPYWKESAKGIITGLSKNTDRRHIIRAALEGIAFQSLDVLKSMEKDVGEKPHKFMVDGGVSKNNFLMQFQANVTKTTVYRPKLGELTARGAAFLAGIGCGFWKSQEELEDIVDKCDTFKPNINESDAKRLIMGWEAAVERVKE